MGSKMKSMDKSVKVSVSFPESVLLAIQERAKNENRNFSNMVTELAKKGLKKTAA
jgi:hypothetical protein